MSLAEACFILRPKPLAHRVASAETRRLCCVSNSELLA